MAWGLKSVNHRRNDVLSRIRWERLEALLAEHYRREGYQVEHVGTGATKQRFDGGIDLKLHKDDAYILVQSKHWNAYKVTHNAVHELLGLMVNEGATGAILVSSGEFTRAAIEAATRKGHVQLVDGDDLRRMLGPLPEPESGSSRAGDLVRTISSSPHAQRIGRALNDRLLSEVEGVIRNGRPSRYARKAVAVGFWLIVLKIVGVLLLFWYLTYALGNVLNGIAARHVPAVKTAPVPAVPQPAGYAPNVMVVPADVAGDAIGRPVQAPAYRPPTPEQIRESRRKADEAMKVIEATTPEM